ncbi:hypothetical protein [Actinoplanes sp. NPDC026619]|uniref:hypothetical protein n=1 Tax=Actinoplanes sp. NPDC026619 TaxID=3155798 RepID=UPI0033CD475E
MTVSAVNAVTTSTAESTLEKYQAKLSVDLAAKAAAKAAEKAAQQDREGTISEDRTMINQAQQAVQREKEETRTASTSGFQSKLDISM